MPDASVRVDTVATRHGVGEARARAPLSIAGDQPVDVGRVVPDVGVVRRDVGRVRRNRDRRREVHLLPTRARLTGERRRRQSGCPTSPTGCPTWVPVFPATLVEADPGHEAGDVGAELHAQLDRGRVGVRRVRQGRPRTGSDEQGQFGAATVVNDQDTGAARGRPEVDPVADDTVAVYVVEKASGFVGVNVAACDGAS